MDRENPDKKKTKPKVVKGVEKPTSWNPNALNQMKAHRLKNASAEDYVKHILAGNRMWLAKAITLIESTKREDQDKAEAIINACMPHSGKSIRIGITGSPGVGKSTFVESFGMALIQKNKKIAVLAVDPSSQISKGSILGDKTRMEKLSAIPNAFIRPSPANEALGGVARKTRETIILCEAAGYEIIFVETVGVGQSEIAVHSMVDFFLLLLLPGSGDELQGIKRGIVEMADLILVNKADGANKEKAIQSQRAYKTALHLFPPKANAWIPKVQTCSAITEKGLEAVWDTIQSFENQVKINASFESKRAEQATYWMEETIKQRLGDLFYNHPKIQEVLPTLRKAVLEGKRSPFSAASHLLSLIGFDRTYGV